MPTDLFYGLLPEHMLLALLVALMLIEIAGKGARAAGVLFVLTVAAGASALFVQMAGGYSVAVLAGEIAVDTFAIKARVLLLSCALIYGLCNLGKGERPKYWMLITSSLLGGMLICLSSGFVSLFLGIELLSMPAFALMVHRGAKDAPEAAFKYLVMSAVASAMILFGISLAYGVSGTLAIQDFASMTASSGTLATAAVMMLLCGFFLKMAVFPFHGWTPDSYAGARLPVTMFLASIVKAAVVLGLVRILGGEAISPELMGMIAVLGIASIFFGNVTAVEQSRFKRLLAYSSIAHAGYMIFALVGTGADRATTLLYYLAVYALTTVVATSCFRALTPENDDSLEQLDGAFFAKPLYSILLLLSVLSMAGIPPMPGFLAKLLIFKSVIAEGYVWPAVIAFAGSFVGVTYYLKIVARLFKTESEGGPSVVTERLEWTLGGLFLAVLLLIVLTVDPGRILY